MSILVKTLLRPLAMSKIKGAPHDEASSIHKSRRTIIYIRDFAENNATGTLMSPTHAGCLSMRVELAE